MEKTPFKDAKKLQPRNPINVELGSDILWRYFPICTLGFE